MSLATTHDPDDSESGVGLVEVETPIRTGVSSTPETPLLRWPPHWNWTQSRATTGPRRAYSPTTLTSRIEHTQLRLRVAALERELLARDRQRQALIDQYERILEARESERSADRSLGGERGRDHEREHPLSDTVRTLIGFRRY